jgi:hypothetical protein
MQRLMGIRLMILFLARKKRRIIRAFRRRSEAATDRRLLKRRPKRSRPSWRWSSQRPNIH